MKGFDLLVSIYDDGLRLSSVVHRIDVELGVVSVGLTFGKSPVCVEIDPDFDSLWLTRDMRPTSGAHERVEDASSSGLWKACLGLPIRWAWVLTDQQGYSDGLQLTLGSNEFVEEPTIQMIGIGSRIRIFDVSPTRRAHPGSR